MSSPRFPRRVSPALALITVLACAPLGCGGSSSSPTEPAVRLLSVGGAYEMAVSLTENTCGSVAVAPLPTTVSHTPGTFDIILMHGPNSYGGRLTADGHFTTSPLLLTGSDGSALNVGIDGQFTTSGLDAVVTVSETNRPGGQAACQYRVRWVGTKQGAPNVIP